MSMTSEYDAIKIFNEIIDLLTKHTRMYILR